ncbi:IS66 family transposase [Desulfosarcina sp. OttesenSCG-928-B08]|nr:IS66 family transposase [Desulfosarcina sp. OttesenSCG-928-B08]
MRTTQQLSITLQNKMANIVKAKVQSGEYATEVESSKPVVKIAPPPPQIIPKGIASEELLAHVAVAKFADGFPFYRQQAIDG